MRRHFERFPDVDGGFSPSNRRGPAIRELTIRGDRGRGQTPLRGDEFEQRSTTSRERRGIRVHSCVISGPKGTQGEPSTAVEALLAALQGKALWGSQSAETVGAGSMQEQNWFDNDARSEGRHPIERFERQSSRAPDSERTRLRKRNGSSEHRATASPSGNRRSRGLRLP